MDATYIRVLNPGWVPYPAQWAWERPDGQFQGIGVGWRDDPGMFNLKWLTLDMDVPPRRYDARVNPLFMRVLAEARFTTLGGVPLPDVAALTTLRQFMVQLDEQPLAGPLADTKPLLQLLGQRRLDHAHA